MSEIVNLYQRRKLQELSARTDVIDEFESGEARQQAVEIAAHDALLLVDTLEPVGDRRD